MFFINWIYNNKHLVRSAFLVSLVLVSNSLEAGPREQAKRIHDRLAGVPPTATVLQEMAQLIEQGAGSEFENATDAAFLAMQHPDFYRTTLKNFAAPWTNREADVFAPLNDYSATVIGMVRDDVDFREVLTGNFLYVGEGVPVSNYSPSNNAHYEQLELGGYDLAKVLVQQSQTSFTGIPENATAGVMTSRAAAKSFFIAGTNRAMFRFTLRNHLCTDLEQVADITRAPDRIRQDVTRSPGGDSRIFRNNCIGCHSGMDPMAQAFAYYNYVYDVDADPDGNDGSLSYNSVGTIDPETGTQVVAKYHFNQNNFPFGFVTPSDDWSNYWRQGRNQTLGWDATLPGTGTGAKSLGIELSNSSAFSSCQVTKVFRTVCLREPANASDRDQIVSITASFANSGYQLKQPFAAAAAYCRGD